MSAAVVCYSLTPLAVALSEGGSAPFLFNGLWRLGAAAGFFLFLAAFLPSRFFSRSFWRVVRGRLRSRELAGVVLAYLDIALFALACGFVPVPVAVMMAETSPLFLMLVLRVSFRRGGEAQYERRDGGFWALASLSFAGFCLTAFSGAPEGVFRGWFAGWGSLAAGIGLALGSALLASLNGLSFRWGLSLSRSLERGGSAGCSRSLLFCVVLAGAVSNLVAGVGSLSGGAAMGESFSFWSGLGLFLGGAAVYPVAGVCWRQANLVARNLGVNLLGYVRPALSLVWLLPFGYAAVARPELLAAGAVLVFLGNAGIGVRRRQM